VPVGGGGLVTGIALAAAGATLVGLLVLVAAACAALGAGVIAANVRLFSSTGFVRATGGTWGVLIFGPALLMQSYALAITLQQGLLGREFSDERREW